MRTWQGPSVSHAWIYQLVLHDKWAQGTLYRHLRWQGHRRKRYGTDSCLGQLRTQVSIEECPTVVASRAQLGDWEVDTIIGKGHQQAVVSLNERKSRLSLLTKVVRKSADAVTTEVIALLKPLVVPLPTLTLDNGKEFAHHETNAQALKACFLFTHPYASWERGLDENTNGLIR